MSRIDTIIGALEDVGDADREWILARLSPAARAALRRDEAGAARDVTDAPTSDSPGEVADLDPALIVSVLVDEPSWVVHALLQARSSWRAEVLRLLPNPTRQDIERLSSLGVRHSPRTVHVLAAALAQAVRGKTPVADVPPFERLVDKIGRKLARKRLGMRS